MYFLLCCVTYNCTVHWADLTYISLLIIFCIIEFVTNKTLNPWTLIEEARIMLSHAKLPQTYWAEAVATAVYIQNRLPTSVLKQETPKQKWCDKQPNVSHMKVFGCVAYAHVPDAERRKLDKKAVKVRFVGYANNAKGYRLFDEEKRRILIRRDVIFNESDFDLKQEVDISCSENKVIIKKDEKTSVDVYWRWNC